MKIQFDASQPYQLAAINAAVALFAGLPHERAGEHSGGVGRHDTRFDSPFDVGGLWSEVGIGNAMPLTDTALLANLHAVQEVNGIAKSDALALLGQAIDADGAGESNPSLHSGRTAAGASDLNGAAYAQDAGHALPPFANFSIEMETGTGKTYVYLRTIFELHRTHGFSKFIIVVPSVAIREGVKTSLRLMREHFRALYDNVAYDEWVYDSRQVSRVRAFAMSASLQIMVMNIDAFRKSENVIMKENDRLSGRRPIEFVRATRPVVILDEPQNMESDAAKAAIASLAPLCTLRYSATHRHAYNLIYRLDPVAAYDLKLVKRIEVDSIIDQPSFNEPYVRLLSVTATKTRLTAKIEIDVNGKDGPRRAEVKIQSPKHQQDLQLLSGGRTQYAGWIVEDIRYDEKSISFSNGKTIYEGQATGAAADEVMRVQIRETVREHFDKELRIQNTLPEGRRLKVLSLFFIDRVANYADAEGKIRRWFVQAYEQIAALPKYAALPKRPVDTVHNGYFAQSKGVVKDTSGTTQADDEAYELIMRDKERLLSLDEPLRFIFSHSALREGWDNPNVFQICTLNDTRSEIKKRQEIGRGLRLPVTESGERCRDENINRLTVIANESYTDFAQKLQSEIADECGVSFAGRVANKAERVRVALKPGWQENPHFQAIWQRIRHKTRYSVQFDTPALIERAAKRIADSPPLTAPRIGAQKAALRLSGDGVSTQVLAVREATPEAPRAYAIPDLIATLQQGTELTRSTIAEILLRSGRLSGAAVNPQQLIDQAMAAIRAEKRAMMVDGIKYELIDGEAWDQQLFATEELMAYLADVVPVNQSIYDHAVVDSGIEREFASTMDGRTDDVRLCVKLPPWFVVKTPLGTYNPDWALVLESDGRVYLVRETKGTSDISKLAADERDKVRCGAAHFAALGVDYAVVTTADEVAARR